MLIFSQRISGDAWRFGRQPLINILSLNCSIAFAPYLIDALSALEGTRNASSKTVRQGGSGLVLTHGGASLGLIYRNHRASLDSEEVIHYLATVGLRANVYDVSLMSDEVVLASVNDSLLVSHPQSEIWLERPSVSQLIAGYKTGQLSPGSSLPEWLVWSAAAGRLLLSDQRSGRWVLLGEDHLEEFERRLTRLTPATRSTSPAPPVISLKGVEIHLQSAFKLARTLRDFAQTRRISAYNEAAPEFKLTVGPAVEGIRISDTGSVVGLTVREAGKWAEIIEAELARLHASESVRGQITTVLADGSGGRFVLQWGDEVFVPHRFSYQRSVSGGQLIYAKDRGFSLLLDRSKDACIALTPQEEMLVAGPRSRGVLIGSDGPLT